jgi:ribonucleoside-triphosphate reductase
MDNVQQSMVAVATKLVTDYIQELDWRTKENSNMAYSLQGMNHYIKGEITKWYWMNVVYPEKVRNAHVQGDLHIHDLDGLCGYCSGLDLEDLIAVGFKGAPGKIVSAPAKHFRTILGQMVNFQYSIANEINGAVALSNVDTLLAPFIYYDKLTKEEVTQALQEYLYNMNVPTRTGMQQPFTNCTMDLVCPKHLADKPVIIGGKPQDKAYGEFQEQMNLFNEVFFDLLTAGDATGRLFSFPKPTINITKDFDWDNKALVPLWGATAKYGIPYFTNFINSDLNPEDTRSMCPLGKDTLVPCIVKEEHKILTLREICKLYKDTPIYVYDEWNNKVKVIDTMSSTKMKKLAITYKDYQDKDVTTIFGEQHLQPVLRDYKVITIPAKDIRLTDQLPVYSSYRYKAVYKPIVNIEPSTENGAVYCITVDSVTSMFQIGTGLITHNCRLRLDLKEVRKVGNMFSANPSTGSIGVCTINLPRLGYLYKDETVFFEKLGELLDIAKEALEIKRKIIEKFTDQGLYPYCKYYLRQSKERFGAYWRNYFSTIATIGMNECCLNMFGVDIGTPRGQEFTKKVIQFINARNITYRDATGNLYNSEAAPAESTCYRLAKIDKERYPDIFVADEGVVEERHAAPFYTNSTNLPVDYTDDVFEMLDKQSDINSLYTGGTSCHLYLGERVKDIEVIKSLIRTVFTRYTIPYISITPTFSFCDVDGLIPGEHTFCPLCKEREIHKIDLEIERLKVLLN